MSLPLTLCSHARSRRGRKLPIDDSAAHPSLRLDAGGCDHLAPFLVVVADDLAELRWRGADHVDPDRCHALMEACRPDGLHDLAMQRVDNFRRRVCGPDETHAGADLEARKA